MKPILSLLLIAVLFHPFALCAQPETFDIITYTPPSGWTKDVKDFATSFSTVNQTAGTWCQLGIYKSVASSGNPAASFSGEWKALVKGATYAGVTEPAPVAATEDGWTINSGASNFRWQDKDAQVLLINVSGFGTMVSILVSMNSDRYMADIEKFLASLDLKKPEQSQQSQQQASPTQSVSQLVLQSSNTSSSTGAPIVVTGAAGVSGIFTSTTNFDDGWTAQPFADYVRVNKGPTTVLLHYAFAVDDEMRYNDMATVVWNRLIVPRYRTSNVRVFQNEQFTYNKIYFVEADAVEVSTGKACHVALRVLVENGVARSIEIISPSMSAFQDEFPNQEKVEHMINYNKFAVVASDIVGSWEESTSAGINMYNTVTGAYAGMNMSASSNSFVFKGDGTYSSNHKGAYGMVGSTTFYDQKYNGKLTVGSWEVTMTNRFEGKADVFFCQYEAVRGGRMLHLTNKTASGVRYSLVRVK